MGAESPPKAVPGGSRSTSRIRKKEAWGTGCGRQEEIKEEEDG